MIFELWGGWFVARDADLDPGSLEGTLNRREAPTGVGGAGTNCCWLLVLLVLGNPPVPWWFEDFGAWGWTPDVDGWYPWSWGEKPNLWVPVYNRGVGGGAICICLRPMPADWTRSGGYASVTGLGLFEILLLVAPWSCGAGLNLASVEERIALTDAGRGGGIIPLCWFWAWLWRAWSWRTGAAWAWDSWTCEGRNWGAGCWGW